MADGNGQIAVFLDFGLEQPLGSRNEVDLRRDIRDLRHMGRPRPATLSARGRKGALAQARKADDWPSFLHDGTRGPPVTKSKVLFQAIERFDGLKEGRRSSLLHRINAQKVTSSGMFLISSPRIRLSAIDKSGSSRHRCPQSERLVQMTGPTKVAEVFSFRRGQDCPSAAVTITTPTRAALLEEIESLLAAGQGFALATLNLDHMVKLRRLPAFRAAYAAQSHVVADGNPVVWLQRLAGRPVELVPGSELIVPLAAMAGRLGVPVALLGATPETLALAGESLVAACPGLSIVARIAPPQGFEPEGPAGEAALQAIGAAGARLCFLALGAPKQEILAARGHTMLPGTGFVSIGAGLDFIAGHQTRAPAWVRRIAMEWAWRMALNPRRLARRYLDCAAVLPGLAWAAWRARK